MNYCPAANGCIISRVVFFFFFLRGSSTEEKATHMFVWGDAFFLALRMHTRVILAQPSLGVFPSIITTIKRTLNITKYKRQCEQPLTESVHTLLSLHVCMVRVCQKLQGIKGNNNLIHHNFICTTSILTARPFCF